MLSYFSFLDLPKLQVPGSSGKVSLVLSFKSILQFSAFATIQLKTPFMIDTMRSVSVSKFTLLLSMISVKKSKQMESIKIDFVNNHSTEIFGWLVE